jgi:hypothetical protein
MHIERVESEREVAVTVEVKDISKSNRGEREQ